MDDLGAGGGGSTTLLATQDQHSQNAIRVIPTPTHSMTDDPDSSRTLKPNSDQDSQKWGMTPISMDDSQHSNVLSQIHSALPSLPSLPPSSSLSQDNESQSPPPPPPPPPSQISNAHAPLPPILHRLPPISSPPASASSSQPYLSWSQPKSPTSTTAPSNPFYTSTAYRSSTPPISSSEPSPLVSPAKRFSSGEVKPLQPPTSPRQPLTDEDRMKFTQLAQQLKTRLTYAALKVENGWEKHSLSEIQNILQSSPLPNNNHNILSPPLPLSPHQSSRPQHTYPNSSSQHASPLPPHYSQTSAMSDISPTTRRRSRTLQDFSSPSEPLTYESFWAQQRPSRPHSQSHSQASLPRNSPPNTYPTTHTYPDSYSFRPANYPSSSISYSSPTTKFHHHTFPRRKPERLSLSTPYSAHTARDQSAAEIMIALASPRTRSEFSSPERKGGETDEEGQPGEDDGRGEQASPTPSRKRVEIEGDIDGTKGLGIRA